jgi:Mn-dependent DtxR family transcriptional regulator
MNLAEREYLLLVYLAQTVLQTTAAMATALRWSPEDIAQTSERLVRAGYLHVVATDAGSTGLGLTEKGMRVVQS